jgi:DNA-binding winged helix-turn-helix (wHTH) protein
VGSSSKEVLVVQFGSFQADLRSGELRKAGIKIKLHAQPFQILAMLLEQPGKLISREEIRQRLWPKDTFVDFDHGLNNAVNRLREALGDSPATPRFIETVPRRGYRFIGTLNGDLITSETSAFAQNAEFPDRRRSLWLIGLALAGSLVLLFVILISCRPKGLRSTSYVTTPAL